MKRMKTLWLAVALAPACLAGRAEAQISRHPTGVNVNAQGATTVFLTFGNLDGYVADEAIWCGELVSAAPDIGNMCDGSTIFGSLPLRFDNSTTSGDDGFTDIMSIPPSVARRAYQAAESGDDSRFFYVRRFVDPDGVGPDQYVTVTCRLTGGGARVPLALLDVSLEFASRSEVQVVPAGQTAPPLSARILYNGTGRLQGRWEVVMPGDEPPTQQDLLTEATLPVELRGTQQRYTELERFNHFLPPTGEFVLPGPDVSRIPTEAEGLYQVVLRIEASADKEGDSNLAAAGAGVGTVRSGAVAGFPMPALRYYVGQPDVLVSEPTSSFQLLLPRSGHRIGEGDAAVLSWSDAPSAVLYRVQVRTMAGEVVLSAVVESATTSYQAPPMLRGRASDGFEWRVVALGAGGARLSSTPWRAAGWDGS